MTEGTRFIGLTHSSFLHTTQNLQKAHNTMNVTKTEESTPTEEKLERQALTS